MVMLQEGPQKVKMDFMEDKQKVKMDGKISNKQKVKVKVKGYLNSLMLFYLRNCIYIFKTKLWKWSL